MQVSIRLPAVLREHAGGSTTVEVEGETVGEVLAALEARYPGVGRRVLDDQGGIRRHVHVYLGDERVRSLGQPLPPGAGLTVLAAISGGHA